MSFSIEVPGDANPLDFGTLCRALQAASSSDYAQRQTAGQQLTSWEQQQGYYSGLQRAFLDRSLPLDVRFLAVIQLKNGIDRYWRLYAKPKNGIKPEEKALIRSRLFQGTVDEPERNLALHNALVVAKIIRIDYPNEWPEALASIIGLLRSSKDGNQHLLHGALQILLRVTKELGSARLRKSQTAIQSVAPEMVYVLSEIYGQKSNIWISHLSSGQGSDEESQMAMQNSLVALRALRRLIVIGYEQPHRDSTVEQFWMLSQNQFGQLLAFVNNSDTLSEMLGKHLLQFTKLHIDMSEHHATSFAFLPNSLPLVRAYWDLIASLAQVFSKSDGIRKNQGDQSGTKAKSEGPLQEKLALKGLLLLRACVKIAFQPLQTFKYRTQKIKADQEKAREVIKTELLQDELVVQIVNTIISHFFVFRQSDLEAWEEYPEDWELQEQGEGYAFEWEVRPCAEKLFIDLLFNFKPLLLPPLLEYFKSAQDPQADIATKEAVYTAMGLSAVQVYQHFDFIAVLSSTLIQDAQKSGGSYKVIRRRIAILISQWAPIEFSDDSRPIVYEIFNHFLNPNDETNDIVVRITAARQLRWIADELDFDVEAFVPYTANVLKRLMDLVENVEADETKLAILESIRILVMRMGDHVSQFGDQLMTALPKVWANTGAEEYMIKQHVIAILSTLVMSMGHESQRYHNFMLPLLGEAAREGSDLHAHLIDESLELWNSILMQSSPPLSKEVIDLADAVLPLLEYQQETAGQAMTLVDSYILISPSTMLQGDLRPATLNALSSALDSKSRAQVRLATVCIENLIRAAADLGGREGISVVMKDMVDIGLMRKMMENLRDAWEANQTTGPNKKVSKLSTVTQGYYFVILARLAMAEPSLFVELLASFGPLDEVWAWLSAEWFSYMSSMDHLERQKLYLLGLTRILELPSPMQELALGKLQDYFSMWGTVLAEVQEGVPNGTDTLTMFSAESHEWDCPKTVAERQSKASDPIHTMPTATFVRQRLQNIVERVGGEAAFEKEWAGNVDRDVIAKFQKLAVGQ